MFSIGFSQDEFQTGGMFVTWIRLGEKHSLAIIYSMKKHISARIVVVSMFFLILVLQSCTSKPELSVPLGETAQFIPTLTPNPVYEEGSVAGQPGHDCENDARFVEDLTFPDGEVVVPGQTIDKRWSVDNIGTCDWGAGYYLVHLGDDEFEAPEAVALYPARADTNAVWQVELQAPVDVGQYVSQWQAQAADGTMFGDVVYILISVEKATPTPTVTPLISETPES
jgi:hypothetical protein